MEHARPFLTFEEKADLFMRDCGMAADCPGLVVAHLLDEHRVGTRGIP